MTRRVDTTITCDEPKCKMMTIIPTGNFRSTVLELENEQWFVDKDGQSSVKFYCPNHAEDKRTFRYVSLLVL